jgi:hypothetical protein
VFGLYEAVTATDAQFIQTDRVRGPGEPWRRLDPGDLATVLPNLNLIGAASAVNGIHPLSGCSSLLRSQSSTASSSSEVGLFLLLKRGLHELLSLLRGGEALVDVFVLVVDEVLVLLKLVVLAAEELVEL